jgi:hypothetical protein
MSRQDDAVSFERLGRPYSSSNGGNVRGLMQYNTSHEEAEENHENSYDFSHTD